MDRSHIICLPHIRSGTRKYYLGNDYTYHDGQDMWTYGSQTYDIDAVSRVKRIYGCLLKYSTPLPVPDYHPVMDATLLLGLDDHHTFQMLLGMLQWLMIIGRPELCQLVPSLNRFGDCPREGHQDLAVHSFRYIKTTLNKQVLTLDRCSLHLQTPTLRRSRIILIQKRS